MCTWSPVGGTGWEGLGGLVGGVSLGAGFEESKDLLSSQCPLSASYL